MGKFASGNVRNRPRSFCVLPHHARAAYGGSPYGSRFSLSSNTPSVARPPAPFQKQTPSRRLPLSRGSICSPERDVAVGAGFGAAHQNAVQPRRRPWRCRPAAAPPGPRLPPGAWSSSPSRHGVKGKALGGISLGQRIKWDRHVRHSFPGRACLCLQTAVFRAASQSSRPQTRRKFDPSFAGACTSQKTPLTLQMCERLTQASARSRVQPLCLQSLLALQGKR